MARISTYAIDGTPVSSDKLIGTDSAGTVTKNYPLGDVAYWLKSSGATAVLGQNNYLFQIALDPDEGRKIGSFSFENYGGDGTAFEDVTNLKFSASSSAGKYIADYLLSTVDQKIMLSQLDAPNNFGIYALVSLTQSSLEPTFYDAVLAFVDGNGALQGNESYGLATYSALNEAGGGTWGSITGTITNQTDLVDYIDAEIAAIPAPATPTLQSVTDAGAITTSDITTGSITSNGNFLITGTGSTVQLRGSSVDFDIQTAAADNVARVATTTGGSARLELYNHISGFNGALEFRATSWENDALVISGGLPNATKFLVSRDPNAATLQVTGDSYFTGNVGIGTTSPSALLEIASNSTNDFIKLTTTGGGATPVKLIFEKTAVEQGVIEFNRNGDFEIYNTDNDGGVLISGSGSANADMYVNHAGNVGIGTTAPSSTFHVAGTARIHSSGNGAFGTLTLGSINDIVGDVQYMDFKNNGSSWMRIQNGNVGIGTTAPSAKLNVRGDNNQSTTGVLEIGTSGTSLRLGGNTTYSWIQTHSSKPLYINELGNNVILNGYGGNVGIGTTAPAAKLDVDGQVHLGPQSSTGFPSIDIASNGRTTIRGSAPALSVRDNNNNGGYIDMGGGTLANINSITSAATLALSTTNMRIGGDIGARLNVRGQDNSTQPTLGLRQGLNSTSTVIDIRNSSNVSTMGITSEGGFYFKDSNLVGRFSFDHDYLPAAADGLTVGIDLRTENASGVVSSLGYIDVTQDDISADESSMRLSVGETTPSEVMRLQSGGNVGIGTTAPSERLEVNGNIKASKLLLNTTNTGYTFYSNGESRINNITFQSVGNDDYLQKSASDGRFWIRNGRAGQSVLLGANDTNGQLNDYLLIDGNTQELRIRTASSDRLVVNSSGNVGIGTTAPASDFSVAGRADISSRLRVGVAGNPNRTLEVWGDHISVTSGGVIWAIFDQSAEKAGIGTSTPTSKLHVNAAAMEQFRIETPGGPAGSGDTKGNVGDIAYDADFFYIKTDNGWGRVPLDFGF